MSKVPMHPYEPGQAESSTTTAIDKGLLVPVAACVYALIVSPLMIVSCSPTDRVCLLEPRLENKVFWPILAAITVILALRHRSRLSLPPHIICLFASLAFAGASVLWAFKPELAFIRFSQQAMIQISIVLPIMLA